MNQNVKEGIRELIIGYFKIDVLNEPLTKDTKENIISTFTYCYNRHMSVQSIAKQLQHSNLSELRDRIIERMGSNYNPFPVRFGELKPTLQMEAVDHGKSLHGYILWLVRTRHEKQQHYLDLQCVPRLNKIYRYKKVYSKAMVKQLQLNLQVQTA